MKKFFTEKKTIEILLQDDDKIQFTIPTYQRPYVWGEEEILKLLQDVHDALLNEEPMYFIGNIYVSKSEENILDVIDGQQRLITLWLTALAFKQTKTITCLDKFLASGSKLRLNFAIRAEVEQYLKTLLQEQSNYFAENESMNSEFLKHIAKGIVTINGFLKAFKRDDERGSLADYIYKRVTFVYNIAPANTNLNALFTALGNSGVQLEQTDILKSQLLKKMEDKVILSKIWEVCENMNDYFENNVLSGFPNTNRNIAPDLFNRYEKDYFPITNDDFAEQGKFTANKNEEIVQMTISEILKENLNEKNRSPSESDKENKLRCRSIVPFSILLLHTYRIFRSENQLEDFRLPFDKKHLLEIFEELISDIEMIKPFFELLWKVRFTFDKYIIKWRGDSEDDEVVDQDEKLRLTNIYKNETSFIRQNKSQSRESILQSVLYFTGGYNQQYWLTPYLSYLLHNPQIDDTIFELEKIDNLMTPGEKKEISWKLIDPIEREMKISDISKLIGQNLGTGFSHYWFYKLEYLLWKDWDKTDSKLKRYRVTSKNSIEHVYPQNPEYSKELEKEYLDNFGNLGLLSVGQNSAYSNQSVPKKREDFKEKATYDSLKLSKIYSRANWDKGEILEHADQMLSLLAIHYN